MLRKLINHDSIKIGGNNEDEDICIIEQCPPQEPEVVDLTHEDETLKIPKNVTYGILPNKEHRGHVIKWKMKSKILICYNCVKQICPMCYSDFHGFLRGHLQYGEPTPCQMCDVSFPSSCAMKAHRKLHKGSVKNHYVCPDCGLFHSSEQEFIKHSLTVCFHLFRRNEYLCSMCPNVSYMSMHLLERHIQNHIVCLFQCQICPIFYTSKEDAMTHTHATSENFRGDKLLKDFQLNFFCQYCQEFVTGNHWAEHRKPIIHSILQCCCNAKFKTDQSFRIHRRKCSKAMLQPCHLSAMICNKLSQKYDEGDKIKGIGCKMCRLCNILFYQRDGNLICQTCLEMTSLPSEVPVIPKEENTVVQMADCPSWLGAQEMDIGEPVEEIFETANIAYINIPSDHNYCLKHDFIEKLKTVNNDDGKSYFQITGEAEEEEETVPMEVSTIETPAPIDLPLVKPEMAPVIVTTVRYKCPICNDVLKTRDGLALSITKLYLHFKNFHKSLTLEIPKPSNKINNNNKPDDEKIEPVREIEKAPEPEPSPEPEQKLKEHEFWDGYYDALTIVERKKIPSEKKLELLEKINPAKRVRKKPKRLVDELLDTSFESSDDEFATERSPSKRNRSTDESPVKRKKSPSKIVEELPILNGVGDQSLTCLVCNSSFSNSTDFRKHLITHRSVGEKYQCMECGDCFNTYTTLKNHLIIQHKMPIDAATKYIEENDCAIEDKTLEKEKKKEQPIEPVPVSPNQCSVCRAQFETKTDLTLHFRKHGLAFLTKNKTVSRYSAIQKNSSG